VPLDAILRDGVRGNADVGALASRDGSKVTVLAWHYHDDDVPGPEAAVRLSVAGLPAAAREAKLSHFRVDEHHGNAYDTWRRMGSPVAPNREQYAELQQASRLTPLPGAPSSVAVENGAATLEFTLPRQGVSLVELEW
jgi:xylan 1,4-beta-xylosidase